MRGSRLNLTRIATTGLAVATLSATTASAAFFESFEDFTGASGSTVDGFSNSNGSWDGNSTYSIVLTDQTDAYDGDSYFRINDQLNAGQIHQTWTLATPEYIGEAVNFSFAFRWAQLETPHSTYPFPSPVIIPQLTDGTDIDDTRPGSHNEYKPPLEQWEDDGILAQDKWYVFNQLIQVEDAETASPTFVLDLTITDPDTGTVVFSEESYFSQGMDEGFDSFAGLRMFTGNSSGGLVDFDAISISPVPEPASLALLAIGGLAIAGRRRRH